MRTSPRQEVFPIVGRVRGQAPTEEARLIGRSGLGRRVLDVLGSPGGPEAIHELIQAEVAGRRVAEEAGTSPAPLSQRLTRFRSSQRETSGKTSYHARIAVSRSNQPAPPGFSRRSAEESTIPDWVRSCPGTPSDVR